MDCPYEPSYYRRKMMKLLSRTTLYLALGFSSAIASAEGTIINNQCTPSGFYQNDAECFIKVRPRRRGEEETNTSTPSSAWALDVTQNGDFCYRSLDKVTLWRPDASESADLSIKESATQHQQEWVPVPFRPNVNEKRWPHMRINQPGEYEMTLGYSAPTTITMHQIPSYVADEVTWMENNGCTQQANKLRQNNQMVSGGSI
jgi:hypothetical protein